MSSTVLLWLPLPILSLLLSSTSHLSSSSYSCIGCPGVRFCSWGCFCSCGSGCGSAILSSFCIRSAFSACCGSGCSLQSFSVFFRMLWILLVLPVFLCVFRMLLLRLPLPVFLRVSACCDSGCSFRFWRSSCCLPYCRFSGCGSSGSGCYFSLHLCSFPIDGLSPYTFVYHRFASSGCVLSLSVSSSTCLFEVFLTLASVPPQPFCPALFCVTI